MRRISTVALLGSLVALLAVAATTATATTTAAGAGGLKKARRFPAPGTPERADVLAALRSAANAKPNPAALASPAATKQQVLPLSTNGQPTYLYTRDGVAAMCTYDGSVNTAVLVNLTSMTSLPGIQVPPAVNTDNHQCWYELGGGMLFVSLSSGGVSAFSIATQALAWSSSATGIGAYGPSYNAKRGELYVVDTAGTMWGFAAATGNQLFSITGKNLKYRPSVVGDDGATVIASDASGKLYGFDPSDQSVSWSLDGFNICQADNLVLFETEFLSEAVAMTCGADGAKGLAKFDYEWGTLSWQNALGAQPTGNSLNNIPITQSAFNFWAYNGTNVDRVNQGGGDSMSETPFPAGVSYGIGLVNLGGTYIVSGDGSATLQYYKSVDGSYAGNVTLAGGAGNAVLYEEWRVHPNSSPQIVVLTDAPAIVLLTLSS